MSLISRLFYYLLYALNLRETHCISTESWVQWGPQQTFGGKWIDGWIDEYVEKWVGRWENGWMEGWMMLRVSVFTKSPCPGRSPFSGQALPSPHSSPAMALLSLMAFKGRDKDRTGAEVRMWQSQPCLCWGEVWSHLYQCRGSFKNSCSQRKQTLIVCLLWWVVIPALSTYPDLGCGLSSGVPFMPQMGDHSLLCI